MIEDWKQCMDFGKMVGKIAVDFSKAFDSLPHGLLIAKLSAYRVDFYSCNFFASYSYNRHQRVTLDDIQNQWSAVSKGVPQGPILGSILFDVFVNDIFVLENDCHIYSYADDYYISYSSETIDSIRSFLTNHIAVLWTGFSKILSRPILNNFNPCWFHLMDAVLWA